jgi:hypothetical protein
MIRLKPFSSLQIEDLLKASGVESRRRKVCASLSQGSWKRALQFSEDEIWEKRKEVFQFLEDPGQYIPSLVDWSTQDSHHLEILVDLLEQITSDFIRWSSLSLPHQPQQDFEWIHSDYQKELLHIAQLCIRKLGSLSFAKTFWMAQAERLASIRHEMTLPLNRKLLVQDILLPWLGVMTPSGSKGIAQ